MGDGSPADDIGNPGSVLRSALFAGSDGERSMMDEPEPPTPDIAPAAAPSGRFVSVGDDEEDYSFPPPPPPVAIDNDVLSVEKRLSALRLDGDGSGEKVGVRGYPNGGVAVRGEAIPNAMGGSYPPPVLAEEAGSGKEEAGVGEWVAPPSPAVARPTAGGGVVVAGMFSPMDGDSAEVSPYAGRGAVGGGMRTSSTLGLSSDDEDEMAAAFAGEGGSRVAAATEPEMTLPSLPRVEEALSVGSSLVDGDRNPAIEEADGCPVSSSSAGSGGCAVVAGLRDVAEGHAGGDCDGSVVLEEMLLDAGAGTGTGGADKAKGVKRTGVPAAAVVQQKAAVLSAVEKEAMALAAACVAEEEGKRAPKLAETTVTETERAEPPPASAAAGTAAAGTVLAEAHGSKEKQVADKKKERTARGRRTSLAPGRTSIAPGRASIATGIPAAAARALGTAASSAATSTRRVAVTSAAASTRISDKPVVNGGASAASNTRGVAVASAIASTTTSDKPDVNGGAGAASKTVRGGSLTSTSSTVSTVAALRSGGFRRDSIRAAGKPTAAAGPVKARRQSSAFGARVADDAAPGDTGAEATRASLRGRDRGVRERRSVGFGRARDGGGAGGVAGGSGIRGALAGRV